MEQLLDLALSTPEVVSPRELPSRDEENHIEGDPATSSMIVTPPPVVSTPEHPKNKIPLLAEGIGPVVNPVVACCGSPSIRTIAESPRKKQPLSQGICGCNS